LIDAISAYKYLLKSYKPENIVIMGNSAGGGLAVATFLCLRDMGLSMPRGGYLQSPWLDLTHSLPNCRDPDSADYLSTKILGLDPGHNRMHYYVADEDLKMQYVSPYWCDDLDGLPPMLIQCGTAERLHDEILGFSLKCKNKTGIHLEQYDVF
jgi:acetyl esterase/lipase